MAQKILIIGILSLVLIGCAAQEMEPFETGSLGEPANIQIEQVVDIPNRAVGIDVAVVPDETGDETTAALDPEVRTYLEEMFCLDNLCGEGDWARWIILDKESTWTVEDLNAVREAVLLSRKALEEVGLDSDQVFEGYRFERHNDFYLASGAGRYAAVRHKQQRIVLADQAFRRRDRFPILHEMGHVIDHQLGRELSEAYHDLAAVNGIGEGQHTADGFWFRPQSADNQSEATADAYALWVIMTYGRGEVPYFQDASRSADYAGIQQVIAQALQSLA